MSRTVKTPYTADMRIGVMPVEHELLDLLDANRAALLVLDSCHLIDTGGKDAAASLRAKPDAGMGTRRREKALSAAARLIIAVEQMDAGK